MFAFRTLFVLFSVMRRTAAFGAYNAHILAVGLEFGFTTRLVRKFIREI
jgi:hypothetical protein